jgi:putative ABC transport system substrate-binding protein
MGMTYWLEKAEAEVTRLRTGMGRRRFLLTSLAGVLAAPLSAETQQTRKMPRIGILTLASSASTPILEAFRGALREIGYVESQNIVLEFRFAHGRPDTLASLAAELVRQDLDIIVADGGQAALAAKRATHRIPIVMGAVGDPIKVGLVASLARPGANVTGLTLLSVELSSKRLELLREAIPNASRVAVLWNPSNPAGRDYLLQTKGAARGLGVELAAVEVRGASDLDSALEAVAAARPSALISLADATLWNQRRRVVDFALRKRIPALFPEREFADDGGLMAYGPNVPANFRRAAVYVDKILKGARPADLPVEEPTKFELIINLKTARALGLTIPPSLLARADQVIE